MREARRRKYVALFLRLREAQTFSPCFVTTVSYHHAHLRAKVLRAWPAARVGPTYAVAAGSWKISQMGLHCMTRPRRVLHAHLQAGRWIDCPSLRCCPVIHSPAGPHSIYHRCCDSTSRAHPPLIIKPFMFSAARFVCLSSVTFIFALPLFVCLSLLKVAARHTSDSANVLPPRFTERRTSASTASPAPSPWCLKRRSTWWLWSSRVAVGDETEPEITQGTCCSRSKAKSLGWTGDWLFVAGFERHRLHTTH